MIPAQATGQMSTPSDRTDTPPHTSNARHGYRRRLLVVDRDATEMVVCGACGHVRGAWYYTKDDLRAVVLVQSCRCTSVDEPLWPRFDFNTSVELCWCCAAAPLASGSRWAQILCPDCKDRALVHMLADGRPLVPLGRHTLMNRVSVSLDDAWASPGGVPEFTERLRDFSERIGVLRRWSARQTLANLAAIGAAGADNLPLADYLAATAALSVDKAAIFAVMCREFGVENGDGLANGAVASGD